MATIDRRKERHMTAIDKENKNDRKRRENAMPLVRSKSTLVILVIVNILQFKEHRHGKMELRYVQGSTVILMQMFRGTFDAPKQTKE